MRTWIKTGAAVAALAASCALAAPASAQSNKVAAEALFDEGIKLMKDGKYAEACPKLADSQKLDPAANTLLNLAACYEKEGLTASAWETYKEAEAAERDAHKDQYQQLAHDRAAALEPNLLKLAISASVKPVDGTEIKLDNVAVPMSVWGQPVPVDPGKHTVVVTAPHKKPWSKEIDVGPDAAKTPATLDVPALEDEPVAAPPPNPTGPAVGTTEPPTQPPGAEQSSWSSQRTVALVVGGLGVVGVVVGSVFGLQASSKNSDSKSHCPRDPNLCDATGVSLRDDARTAGNISTIAFGVGAAALVGGVVLWFTAPHPASAPRTASARVVPTLGGAMVEGVW